MPTEHKHFFFYISSILGHFEKLVLFFSFLPVYSQSPGSCCCCCWMENSKSIVDQGERKRTWLVGCRWGFPLGKEIDKEKEMLWFDCASSLLLFLYSFFGLLLVVQPHEFDVHKPEGGRGVGPIGSTLFPRTEQFVLSSNDPYTHTHTHIYTLE